MASVPVHHLLAREERGSWPELFALVGSAGLPVPEPLSYIAQTQIEVMVLGMLRVWVNRRRVSIGATSRVGELLVLFLENKGQASVEKLISCLWPEALVKDKRGALWQLINDLRRTLGWPGSVQALRGGYMLDPTTQWNYDADNLRTIGGKSRVFLEGIYGGWVDEVRQELSGDEP
jgi:DNA-binding response OmpR family regulator